MKILVLGMHRSRSNYFLDVVSENFNLTNFYEPYRPIYSKHLDPLENNWWESKKKKSIPGELISDIKDKSNLLECSTGFAMKFEITHLTMFPYDGKLFDFDLFKFYSFDKIYITRRSNIIDTIASLTVAHSFGKWLYRSNDLPMKEIQPFQFDLNNFHHRKALFTAIWDAHVLELMYDYFKENRLNHTVIEYENMDEYIENSFHSKNSQYIKSNYDYRKIIQNYSDIENFKNEMMPKVLNLFNERN